MTVMQKIELTILLVTISAEQESRILEGENENQKENKNKGNKKNFSYITIHAYYRNISRFGLYLYESKNIAKSR